MFLHISLGGQQWWGVWNSILKKCFKNTGQAGISNDNSYMNKDEMFVYQGGDGRGSI